MISSAACNKEINIPALAQLAREGYAILTPVPSCTLMFKQEIPLMYPNDPDVRAVRGAMFDPFEYLGPRNKDGLLRTDFTNPLGRVSESCAVPPRVQNIGQKTRELLENVPGTKDEVERCSGHDVRGASRTNILVEQSMKIGRPASCSDGGRNPDSRELGLCDRRAPHRAGHRHRAPGRRHPISLIRMAMASDQR